MRCIVVIAGLKLPIRVVIVQSILECQCNEWRGLWQKFSPQK